MMAPTFTLDYYRRRIPTLGVADRRIALQRRTFLFSSAAALAGALLPRYAAANVPKPASFDTFPPTNSRDAFIDWMAGEPRRGPELPRPALGPLSRCSCGNHDVWNKRNKRAFLMTPREEFVLQAQISAAPTSAPFSTSASA